MTYPVTKRSYSTQEGAGVEKDASARPLNLSSAPHVTLIFDLLRSSCCDTMSVYRNVSARVVKICKTVLEISRRKLFLWPISASRDLDLWPPDPQSWPFHAMPRGPLVPICIEIASLVVRTSCSQVSLRSSERTRWECLSQMLTLDLYHIHNRQRWCQLAVPKFNDCDASK